MDAIAVSLHREHPIAARLVRDLYDHAGWWPERAEADIRRVLEMAPAVGAWAGDRLVGFARVVTDGIFHAYLEDVVVHDEYRRRGVGASLIDRLVAEVGTTHLVSLFCKPRLAPLYEKRGFQPTNQVMMHRQPNGQSNT